MDYERYNNAKNLWLIIKQRTTRIKGKRVVLKGQFHISMQELCNAVIMAKKAAKMQKEKKRKTKAKARLYEVKSKEEVDKEVQDDSESEIGDCIIVDVE